MENENQMATTIEIFKTNVENGVDAARIVQSLTHAFPGCRINFDLHDCDKILRVEGCSFEVERLTAMVRRTGFDCELIDS